MENKTNNTTAANATPLDWKHRLLQATPFRALTRSTVNHQDRVSYTDDKGRFCVMQVASNLPGFLAGTVRYCEGLTEMQTNSLSVAKLLWQDNQKDKEV